MTSNDLLQLILQLNSPWVPQDELAPPRRLRMRQCLALQKAFGLVGEQEAHRAGALGADREGKPQDKGDVLVRERAFQFRYLVNGGFLRQRDSTLSQPLLDKARQAFLKWNPDFNNGDVPIKVFDPSWLWQNLLGYRQRIYDAVATPKGMLEGFSLGLSYSWILQAELNQLLVDNIAGIDDVLCELLDPLRQEVTLQVLTEEFGFPNVIMHAVDAQWVEDGI